MVAVSLKKKKDISFIDKFELGEYFPEIKEASYLCKFNNCMHINEPKCEVLKRIEGKQISKSRYKSYLLILNEIEKNRRY